MIWAPSQARVLRVLEDGRPHTLRDVVKTSGLNCRQVYMALYRCWEKRLVLRTSKALVEGENIFKGRAGRRFHARPYHIYVLRTKGVEKAVIDGSEFVSYSREYLDPRGGRGLSKAKIIMNFLKENSDRAFFSRELADALKDKGVKISDIMGSLKRYSSKGLVYVRGYKTEIGQTPFVKGFLLTWIEQGKPREMAIDEAIVRTNVALEGRASQVPLVQRVNRIREMIYESSRLGDIVGITYLQNILGATPHELEGCLTRAMQLYPEIREIKLFGIFRYFHHSSMSGESLNAAMEMKKNYIRITQSRWNRAGHNWEACAEWFIDRFSSGAEFETQQHRTTMDPRRITIHLLKPTRGRRNNAELDRVWRVKPLAFGQPITYILECKWGLVDKDHLDDIVEVLKWSKEFGFDSQEGRQIKQGVRIMFAASAFNPKATVQLKDQATISLAQYAARMNIEVLWASELNSQLHSHGVAKRVSVQKICKAAGNEDEVRSLLDRIWEKPDQAEALLSEAIQKNRSVYELEELIEQEPKSRIPAQTAPAASPDPSQEPSRIELTVPA